MAKSRKILTAQEINELNDKIVSKGFTPITQYQYIQQSFSRIVKPMGMVDGGNIRTLEETNEFLKRKYKEDAILVSQEEYDKMIEQLNDRLIGYKSMKDVLRSNRNRLISVIEDAQTYTMDDRDIDLSKIKTERLLQLVNEAHRMARGDSSGSSSFYEHLMNLLEDES